VKLLRRVAASSVAAVLVAGALSVLTPSTAEAHGAMMVPGSRTYLCWRDGLTPQGNIVPNNPACAAAVAISGDNTLYNWFSVLRSDGAGRMRGFIPDGQLCSGGNTTFSGYNLARSDWPVTHLTAGATIEWRYSNWAHHPGTFRMYITKDGFNPNQPLTWDDLEETPFLSVTNPPQRGAVGTNDGHYYWTGQLPANKSGRHIIYSVWERSDSTETFYGCSDVVFDGGNGEVTGIGPGSGPTGGPTDGPTTGPSQPGGNGQCEATATVTQTWNGGFQGTLTLRNTGTAPISPWTARFTVDSGVTITSGWNGTFSQSGSLVTVTAPSWSQTLAPGATYSVGFNANGNSSNITNVSCG